MRFLSSLFQAVLVKAKLASVFASLILFGMVGVAQANPVDVSYTVTGSPGSWVYDFSVTNGPGNGTEIYLVGVSLPNAVQSSIVYPTGWIASSPGGSFYLRRNEYQLQCSLDYLCILGCLR